jgi:prolyl 4-hydroxylase
MMFLPEFIGDLRINENINNELHTIIEESDEDYQDNDNDNICKNVLSNSPVVYTIDNMLTDEECEHFISLSKGKLKRALVSDNSKGVQSNGRTGSNCWLNHELDSVTKSVGNKISKIVGIPLLNAEAYQIVYYDETQEYRQHYDSFDHDYSEKSLRCLNYGGQRMATALCYLNTVEEGGGTKLTKINLETKAIKGRMLVFWNVLPNSNIKHPLSEHAGMPVIKGYKYAFNLWFRECPRTMLYRDFNPGYYKKMDNEIKKLESLPSKNEKINYNGLDVIDFNNNIYKYGSFIDENDIKYIENKFYFNNSKTLPSLWIKKNEMPILIDKIEKLCKINKEHFENINVVRYSSKYVHRDHHDAYDINSDKGKKYMESLGQRIWTVSCIISDNMEFGFTRINVNCNLKKGDVIFYKNTLNNEIVRNDYLIKSIINKSDDYGYIANIYVREKDELPRNSLNNNSSVDENYMQTYYEVLSLFKSNNVVPGWREHKSFKIITNGPPFGYLVDHVNKLIKQKEVYKGSLIQKQNLNATYNFSEYNPIIVENVIEDSAITIFKDYYREAISKGYFVLGDNQSNRYKSNNEAFSRFLHYEILPLIEKIVCKKLKPTYSYLSAYTKNADLPPHTDRPDCEYTVSFVVDKPNNKSWPIYFDKTKQPIKGKGRYDTKPPKEECINCDCGSNGLMIFNGRDHIHYREALEYDFYNILLLHYKGYND